jgi:hypothetical protein
MSTRILLLASICLAACNQGATQMMNNPDMAKPLDNALKVQIGPFELQSGVEVVKCVVVPVPSNVDIDVVRLRTTLAPGSHHMILYRTDATEPRGPYDCTSFDGVFRNEAPVFIAESASSDMQLPTGVAYRFKANQLVRLEAHYINTTSKPIMALGAVELVPGAPNQTYQPAEMMMCGSAASLYCDFGGGVRAGEPAYKLPVGFYNGNAVGLGGGTNVDLTQLKIFAFTSHQHHRGTNVTIWRSMSNDVSSNATQIYSNDSWDNPPLTVLPDDKLLTFNKGEGFAWQCTYNTVGDTQDICFGESFNDEMCFIWAYYYPSVGRFIAQHDCWAN